jgi:HK97 gp10 family phage protein
MAGGLKVEVLGVNLLEQAVKLQLEKDRERVARIATKTARKIRDQYKAAVRPRRITGELEKTVKATAARKKSDKPTATVKVGDPASRWLEYGTVHQEAQPTMAPIAAAARERYLRELAGEIGEE